VFDLAQLLPQMLYRLPHLARRRAADDLKSLSHFLTDRLMQVPGVAGVRSMICLEEVKPLSSLPIEMEYL
jgi:hypothetical protein